MSIRLKIFVFIFSIALIPLLVASVIVFTKTRSEIIREVTAELEAVAQIQESRLNETLFRYLDWLKLLTSRSILKGDIRLYEQGFDSGLKTIILESLNNAKKDIAAIESISIISPNGDKILSTDTGSFSRANYSTELYFQAGKKENQFHDIFQDDNGILQIRLVGPLMLNGEFLGVLEIITTAEPIVAITRDYTGLGESGEVLLGKKNDNGDAVFVTPLRFDSTAALRREVSKDHTNVPIVSAVSGQEKTLFNEDTVDYRGMPVFAITRFLENLQWGIVVKIDQDEAFAHLHVVTKSLILLFLLTVLAVIASAFFTTRFLTRPILELTGVAEQVTTGDFSGTVRITTHDELGKLAIAFNQMLSKLRNYYQQLSQEVNAKTKELSERLKQINSQNVFLEQTKKAMINILEDVEEEKQNLAREKDKNKAILQGIGDGVFVIDEHQRIILFNKMAEQISGFSEKYVLGKIYHKVLRFLFDGTQKVNTEFVTEAFKTGEIQKMQNHTELVHKNGERIPVADSSAPLKDRNGEIIGCVVVFRDVRKEREIDRMKTDFLSIASHQLRTPLGAIKWNMEAIIDEDFGHIPGEVKKALQDVYNNTQRLISLVNDLLNVSRIDQNRVQDMPEPTQIETIITAAIRELTPLSKEKKVRLALTTKKKLPKITLDPKRFREVIENLLSNAIKYNTEGGAVDVELLLKKQTIDITIADTGIGIPRKDQPKLFQRFFRAENALLSETEGSGLGLYVVRAYLQSWGGKIRYKGDVGKGSTFFITLPLRPQTNPSDSPTVS